MDEHLPVRFLDALAMLLIVFDDAINRRTAILNQLKVRVMGLGRLVKKVCCFANARKIAHAEKWRGG